MFNNLIWIWNIMYAFFYYVFSKLVIKTCQPCSSVYNILLALKKSLVEILQRTFLAGTAETGHHSRQVDGFADTAKHILVRIGRYICSNWPLLFNDIGSSIRMDDLSGNIRSQKIIHGQKIFHSTITEKCTRWPTSFQQITECHWLALTIVMTNDRFG